MNSEKQKLIGDLLDPSSDARREAILEAGGRILRHRRRQRFIAQSLAALAPVVLAVCLLRHFLVVDRPVPGANSSPGGPADRATAESNRSLTDAQLLSLFPEVPVGLATLRDGSKRLIFPRPADAERFVKRL